MPTLFRPLLASLAGLFLASLASAAGVVGALPAGSGLIIKLHPSGFFERTHVMKVSLPEVGGAPSIVEAGSTQTYFTVSEEYTDGGEEKDTYTAAPAFIGIKITLTRSTESDLLVDIRTSKLIGVDVSPDGKSSAPQIDYANAAIHVSTGHTVLHDVAGYKTVELAVVPPTLKRAR